MQIIIYVRGVNSRACDRRRGFIQRDAEKSEQVKILYDNFPLRARVFASDVVSDDEFLTVSIMEQRARSRLVTALRAVVTDEIIMIAADSDKGPVLLFKERYDPNTLTITKGVEKLLRVRTLSGKTIVIERDANCGCGSKLRGWNPYKTVYSSKDPTE